MSDDPAVETWHHGIMARWWADFVEPEPDELAYYQAAIERYGEPALDLGCGAGRLLVPLLAAGFDLDGADVSADMLAQAARPATEIGRRPGLFAQAIHRLDTGRRYRTIFACGVVGIGGSREQDLAGFRRVLDHLEPGGAFIIGHTLPTAGENQASWAKWLPHQVGELPRPWSDEWDRKTAADGDELGLNTRLADFHPVQLRLTFEVRARQWHDGEVVAEETHRLSENLYFAPELVLMLEIAGFVSIEVVAAYSGETPFDHPAVVITGRRAS